MNRPARFYKYKVILPDAPIKGVPGTLVGLIVEFECNPATCDPIDHAKQEAIRAIPALEGNFDDKLIWEVTP